MWTVSRTTLREICKERTLYSSSIFLAFLLSGCVSPKLSKKNNNFPSSTKILHKIHLGALDFTQKDDQHQLLWSLTSKNSEVTYRENGTLYGLLQEVKGQFYRNEKPLTTFKASLVEVDQQKQTLKMKKKIEIYSYEHKIRLYADNAYYLPKEKKILAEGNIKIESKNFISGPFTKVRSSLDLQDIGTSDTF